LSELGKVFKTIFAAVTSLDMVHETTSASEVASACCTEKVLFDGVEAIAMTFEGLEIVEVGAADVASDMLRSFELVAEVLSIRAELLIAKLAVLHRAWRHCDVLRRYVRWKKMETF